VDRVLPLVADESGSSGIVGTKGSEFPASPGRFPLLAPWGGVAAEEEAEEGESKEGMVGLLVLSPAPALWPEMH